MSRWQEQTLKGACLRHAATTVKKRWLHGCSSLPFESWKDSMLRRTTLWRSAVTVVRRWQQLSMSASLSIWIEHIFEHQRLRKISMQVMRRRNKTELFGALSSWHETFSQHKGLKMSAKKIMSRWKSSQLNVPWHAWYYKHTKQRRLSLCARQMGQRCSKLNSGPVFQSWKAEYLLAQGAKRMAQKNLFRWNYRIIRGGFHVWYRSIARWLTALANLDNIVARLCCWSLAKGFGAFVQFRADHSRIRAVIERGFAHLAVASVGRAFERWSDQLGLLRHLREEKQVAFKRWAQQLYDLREQYKQAFSRLMRKTALHFVSVAFDEWADHVAYSKGARTATQHCKTVVRHFTKAVLRIAFHSWIDNVHTQIKARLSQDYRLSMMTGVAALLLAAWSKTFLSELLSSWANNTITSICSRKKICERLMMHWRDNQLSHYMFLWISNYQRQMHKRRVSNRLLDKSLDLHRRWNLLVLSPMFLSWARTVSRNRQLRLVATHVVATHVLKGWERQNAASALQVWKQEHTRAKEEQAIVREALQAAPAEIAEPSLSSPPGPDTWWTNMQRNMSISELRLSRLDQAGNSGHQASRSPPRTFSPPPLGRLRFRQASQPPPPVTFQRQQDDLNSYT